MTNIDLPFDDEKQRALYDLWNEARGDHLLPHASAIDPIKMVNLLPEIAIFEYFSDDDIRYRLVGTLIVERFAMDPTGRNILEITSPNSIEMVHQLFHNLLHRPAGAIVHYKNTYTSGKVAPVRSILLPMTSPDAARPRILSLHSRAHATAYDNAQQATTVGTTTDEIIWLDIGAGVPQTGQADG